MNLAPFTLNRSLQDHEVYDRIYGKIAIQRLLFRLRYFFTIEMTGLRVVIKDLIPILSDQMNIT